MAHKHKEPQNNEIILPYLREAYDYGEYKYDSHSVSPNGNYIAMYLTIIGSDGANPFAEPNVTTSVLKLFKICDDGFEPQLTFCKDLLNLSYCDNLSILWSATGNKLICEYQINDADQYNLIYFDITDEMDTYPIHNVFTEHETYKWEHSMSFSEDDSLLVTVYNREIIRVFEYSAETRNYHFKTEETYDSNIYAITNIFLTDDNKLIVSLYNSTDVKHIVVSYQINDKTELQYLTENSITTSVCTQIFNSNKCMYDGHDYLLLLVTYGINYHSPSHIYIYDLTELKITEIVNIHRFKEDRGHAYMVGAHKMLFGTESFPDNEDERNYTTTQLLCYSSSQRTNLVIDKYFWTAGKNHLTESMFNIFTKEKIFTAYSSHEYTGMQNINGRLSHQYNQLHKTSNKVYMFTNDEREPYKAMYNLNRFTELMPIRDIKFIHDTPSHVICEYNNKLWFGHSLLFCEEKNIDILTNLLHEYMPFELCHLVAKYCC